MVFFSPYLAVIQRNYKRDTSVKPRGLFSRTIQFLTTKGRIAMNKVTFLLISNLLLVTACGGSGSSNTNTSSNANGSNETQANEMMSVAISPEEIIEETPSIQSGLLNAGGPVENVRYITESQSGSTNETGEYRYISGEEISFFIGDVLLGTLNAQEKLNILDLVNNHDEKNSEAANIMRLLRALDSDLDSSNGVQIDELSHTFANGMNINFNNSDFDVQSAELLRLTGSALPSSLEALSYISKDLGGDINCAADNTKVGQTTSLQTHAYNSRGNVTIINNCTLLVSNFSYTGGGLPEVYFYTGPLNHFAEGSRIGANLYGQNWDGEHFVISVSSGQINQLDAISLWCIQARASFADSIFRS
ncbi:MAG: hypothetical protein ACI93R_003369 [Flavobacteriales bacterium]